MSRRIFNLLGYAIATAVQASVALISVPLLTRQLSPSEFGQWMLWEPLIVAAAQVSLLGVNLGLIRLVGEGEWHPSKAWRRLLPWSLVSIVVIGFFLSASLSYCLKQWAMFLPFLIAMILEGVGLVGLATLRSANKSFAFALVLIAKALTFLVVLGSAKFLDIVEISTANDVLWVLVGATFVGTLMASGFCLLMKDPTYFEEAGFGFEVYAGAVKYGAPLMGAGLVAAIIAVGDRYAINHWMDHASVGRYVVLVKVAAALNFLAMPLNMWFPSARFAHMKDADQGATFFRNCSFVVFGILLTSAGTLWLAAPALVDWFNPGQSFDPLVVVLLLLGAVATGLMPTMNVGLLKGGRTHWTLTTTLLSGCVQILLLVLLVPAWGAHAAAAATCVAACLALLAQNLVSQRLQPVPYAYRGMLALGVFSVLLGAGMHLAALPLELALLLFVVFMGLGFLSLFKLIRRGRYGV